MLLSTEAIKERLMREASSDQRSHNCPQMEFVIPRLNHWVMQENLRGIYILGTVNNHPKYSLGARIKTSRIMSYHKVDGRNIISTHHSIYELGEPTIQLQGARENVYRQLKQKVGDMQADPWYADPVDPSDMTGLAADHPKIP